MKNIIMYGTTTWIKTDSYSTRLPVRNRLKTLFDVLRGFVEITWQVPTDKKNKAYVLKGKLRNP